MYFYTYKITCLLGTLAGKYYLGKHRTNNLDDRYTGSGKIITDYFKHYGKVLNETYTKEIIQFYDNYEDLTKAEIELIGDLYETDDNCINIKKGGDGGNGGNSKGFHHTEETKRRIAESEKGEKNYAYGKKLSEEHKKKISESVKKTMSNPEIRAKCSHVQTDSTKAKISKANTGKKRTEETKLKMSKAHKGRKLSEEQKAKLRKPKVRLKGRHWILDENGRRKWI